MRNLHVGVMLALLSVTLIPLTASPQQTAASGQTQTPKLFASAEDVAALIAKAKAGMKPGQPAAGDWILKLDPTATSPSATFPNGHVHLDYLTGVIPNAALVHEHKAELFYILDGSGVVLLGGKLRDEARANAETLRGSGVDGGRAQHLAKGDFLLIPENTPHFFNQIDGTLVFMSLMLPR